MKNKFLGVLTITTLILSLCGCGDTGNNTEVQINETVETQEEVLEENATTNTVEVSSLEVSEQSEETTESEETIETEKITEPEVTVEMKELIISDRGFEDQRYVSENYFLGYENEKWWLYHSDGQLVESDELDGRENGWEKIVTFLDGGAFSVSNSNGDGKYSTWLYKDENGLKKICGTTNSTGYISDYRDGIICVKNDDLTALIYAENQKNIIAFSKTLCSYMGVNRGHIVVNYNSYVVGVGQCWMYDTIIASSLLGDLSKAGCEVVYKYDDKDVIFMNNVPNKEGWIYSAVLKIDIVDDELIYDNNGIKYGFFNTYTNKFVEILEEWNITSTTYMMEDNGQRYATVQGNKAILNIGDGEEKIKRIFDLSSEDFASDKEYKYVAYGFNKDKYIGVQNLEDKWGYIDGITCQEASEWYEDATIFCNGYAMVKIDGLYYLINEDFQVCSEGIDAEGAYGVVDYLDYFDYNGKSIFYIQRNDLIYKVTVE